MLELVSLVVQAMLKVAKMHQVVVLKLGRIYRPTQVEVVKIQRRMRLGLGRAVEGLVSGGGLRPFQKNTPYSSIKASRRVRSWTSPYPKATPQKLSRSMGGMNSDTTRSTRAL